MNEEEESPYCDVCGTCGDIGCCGITSFIEHHIKGKTNCKNEERVIQDLISICEYETDVFKKNNSLEKELDKYKAKEKELREYIDFVWHNDYTDSSLVEKVAEVSITKILQILDGSDK